MTEQDPDDVTPNTLHDDLTAVFRTFATRESFEEMVRLLREHNRQLEVHIRDEHPATQAIRHASAEAKHRLAEALRRLLESQHRMDDLRGRDNDEPAA
ncbi:MAG TPA: hypothetical protein VK548_25630 [Candidatus Acidoferrum sp.]|nr:hypothetical protein [Candidatus Acidoferrum sp.]